MTNKIEQLAIDYCTLNFPDIRVSEMDLLRKFGVWADLKMKEEAPEEKCETCEGTGKYENEDGYKVKCPFCYEEPDFTGACGTNDR